MKKLISLFLCSALMLTLVPFVSAAVTSPSATEPLPQSLKILCIGNSFGLDTMEYLPHVAKSMGVKDITFATLYIGGCSINRHYTNAVNDYANYEYYTFDGERWNITPNRAIRATLQSEDWDYVAIQHGTGDGSRYAEKASYENLANLIRYVKSYVPSDTKIAFNMTWVGEKSSNEELSNVYGNDTLAYYRAITALTRDTVMNTEGLDFVSPTGTAIQNARTADIGLLTRDGYHLSLINGRYIASLTFFKALTGADISNIGWCPQNMSSYAKAVAIESVNNAHKTPFAVTDSVLEAPPFSWPTNVTYGQAATPDQPFFAHAAKTAPTVSKKVDLLSYFNLGGSTHPVLSATAQTANGLGISIDLDETPYLYYSVAVPTGANFTFSLYSNTNYAPWLTFLDASKGNNKLSEGAETWNSLYDNGHKQYITTGQTGCIDMRQYTLNGALTWIVNQMKLYGSTDGSETVVSYFFFGSDGTALPYVADGESLLPTAASQLTQVDGKTAVSFAQDGSLTLARAADSALAWPSVRYNCNKLIDLAQTPYLHLKMTNGTGCANGHLHILYPDGNTGKVQLSALVKNNNVDFTEPLDAYVDLSEALGTSDVITLQYYTLSVYGDLNADITWEAFSLHGSLAKAGDVNGDEVVNTADATAIFRHLLGHTPLSEEALKNADYDGNGTVSTSDVRRILTDLVNA